MALPNPQGSWADEAFPSGSALPAGPQPGDVMLRREPAASGHYYTLGLWPAAAQIAFKTRSAALAVAEGYALEHQTRVWEEDNGVTRPVPSASRPGGGPLRPRMAWVR